MKDLPLIRHRVTAVAAAALMTGGVLLGTSGAATAVAVSPVGIPAEVSPADQQAILAETNGVRRQAGQPPLTWDTGLASASQAWADDPRSTAGGGLRHDDSAAGAENMSGAPPSGATAQWAGEKAAYDADSDHDPETNAAGYAAWGHYANMTDGSYTKMGCGAKSGVPVPGEGWVTVCRYN
ncbi:CAP domain-containing protein [Streptomyces sp. NPDC006512]|uniref:CAP domain-containing protein n=1 Tax=Streptomyces sp. NPDC006512 TaxID=3154307 RepID=UPI0033BFAA5A